MPSGSAQGAASVLTVFGGLLMFLLVVVAAWACTRFVGRRFSAGAGAGSGRLRVVERVALGPDRALVLVRAAGRVFLVGSAPQQLTLLAELDADAFPESGGQPEPTPADFASLFEAVRRQGGKFRGKKEKPDG
ncbi:MAG: flagellar biosynthetic protein FliO [Anaerotruncus sp.]|nr:flagellar biosynthetic protein FliO [Anaerotruncus sp.]